MTRISLILWDYSGVLVEDAQFDVALLHTAFRLPKDSWLGIVREFTELEGAWDKVERGEASLSWFSAELNRRVLDSGGIANHEAGKHIWWGGVGFPTRRTVRHGLFDLINEIASMFTMGIATNNVSEARSVWQQTIPMETFTHVFDSSEVGARKPELAYWDHVETATGIPPHEILLIDDRDGNVLAAQSRGWNAIIFISESQCISDIYDILGIESEKRSGS